MGKKSRHVSFAALTAAFIDKPFRPGARGPEAYDCLGLCYAVAEARGKADQFPDSFGPWTWDNYHELFQADRDLADRTLQEAFDVIGQEVPVTEVLAGDLVIVRTPEGRLFPAVYAGNSLAIATFNDRGVRAFRLDYRRLTITKARRL